jgi:hypothetical protein
VASWSREDRQRADQERRSPDGATGADERAVRSMIETSNGYSYPPLAAVEAVRRVLAGGYRPSFQTPVTVLDPPSPRASPIQPSPTYEVLTMGYAATSPVDVLGRKARHAMIAATEAIAAPPPKAAGKPETYRPGSTARV